jgi:Tryptophan-associated transmembrane protein (Trp_oprn_chp)
MASGITSTARPTGLRLAGTACVALGAIAAGVGATREWAAIGFTADVERAADVSVHGIDVWEGKVVLFAAVASLLVMLAMRISGSRSTRRGLAIALIVLGALCVWLPVADAVRAKDRFGGAEGDDRLTRTLSVQLGLPEEVVRERLSELLDQDLRVEISQGLWVTAVGGVLLVAGGLLGLAWVRLERPPDGAVG